LRKRTQRPSCRSTGLYDPNNFDPDEYFYFDHTSNGDMHEVILGEQKSSTGRNADELL
jgi:hypothetical protein